MNKKTIKAHLRQVKKRLIKTKDNIEGYEYWTKENEFGVVELEKQCIANNLSIIKNHLQYLTNDSQ